MPHLKSIGGTLVSYEKWKADEEAKAKPAVKPSSPPESKPAAKPAAKAKKTVTKKKEGGK